MKVNSAVKTPAPAVQSETPNLAELTREAGGEAVGGSASVVNENDIDDQLDHQDDDGEDSDVDELDQQDDDEDHSDEITTPADSTPATPANQLPPGSRTITLTPPVGTKTAVQLIVVPLDGNAYHAGFSIIRSYDPKGYPKANLTIYDETTFATLADAVYDAADSVDTWLGTHSADDDKRAKAAREWVCEWIDAFKPEAVVWEMFDAEEGPGPEKPTEEKPADSASVGEQVAPPVIEDKWAVTADTNPLADVKTAIREIRRECDPLADVQSEIDDVSDRIVNHSVEISNLEQKLKDQKSLWKSASKEQSGLFVRRAEIIAGRDAAARREFASKAEVAEAAAGSTTEPATIGQAGCGDAAKASPDASKDTRPADVVFVANDPGGINVEAMGGEPADSQSASVEEVAARRKELFAPAENSPGTSTTIDNGEWRKTKIETLDGITPAILKILEGNNILTMGDWADVPAKKGIEYTQLSHDGSKLTEARLGKIQSAMDTWWKANPLPVAEVAEVKEVTVSKMAESAPLTEIDNI